MPRPSKTALLLAFALFLAPAAFAAEKVFDPTRDPAKDLVAAEAQAKAQHKNILLDVGGNWCSWCILLDRTLHEDAALATAFQSAFVVVHVNWSEENKNEAFLSQFPKVNGYPYFFILSPSGKLLDPQPTDPFESDHKIANGYNHQAILDFVNHWSKPQQ